MTLRNTLFRRGLAGFVCAVALAGAGSALASSIDAAAAQAAIDQRVMGMKDARSAMATLRRMVKGQEAFDRPTALAAVQVLKEELVKMPEEFPPGSKALPSDAKPEVWTDWAGFLKAVDETKAAVDKLKADATAAADVKGIQSGYQSLDKACEGCHDKYRK